MFVKQRWWSRFKQFWVGTNEPTCHPRRGEYRAEQLTWLAATSHQRRTMPQLGEWLDICEDSDLVEDVHGETATVIRQLRRDYQKRVKLPQSLVEELARATVLGQQAWVQARQADDFASFIPVLTTIIDLKRQQAEAIGYEESPYDALLDDYEPGETTAKRGACSFFAARGPGAAGGCHCREWSSAAG